MGRGLAHDSALTVQLSVLDPLRFGNKQKDHPINRLKNPNLVIMYN